MFAGNLCTVHRWLPAIALSLAPSWAPATGLYASIIIDDLGDNLERSREVAALPAPVALAIMPDTPYSKTTAELALQSGKEVLLHMPMQSVRHHRMAPGALTLHMSRQRFVSRLRQCLDSIPGLVGVNNHMGSLLTRHPGHMAWLMSTLSEHERMLFVDSRTTGKSVALRIAEEHDVPNVQRDVFLDPASDRQTIERQFQRFIELVREQGHALAIAHPYPNSLELIHEHLDELEDQGIELVSITDYVNKRRAQHVTCTGTACAGM